MKLYEWKDMDFSINPYQEEQKPKGYIKQLQWDMAIGLQQVENLRPSKYLEQISKKYFGWITNQRSRTKF